MNAEKELDKLLNAEFEVEVLEEVFENVNFGMIKSLSEKLATEINRKINGWTNEKIHNVKI